MATDSFPAVPTRQSEGMAQLSQDLEAAQAEAAMQRAEFAQVSSAWERTSATLTREIADRAQTIASHELQIEAVKQELDAVYRSSSWKITAPLRAAMMLLKRLRSKKVPSDGSERSSSSRLNSADEGPILAGPSGSEFQSLSAANSRSEISPHSTASVGSKLVVIDQLDTSAETETVQRIYRQFTRARKQALQSK